MTNSPKPVEAEWEKEFDKNTDDWSENTGELLKLGIKPFIRRLLADQRHQLAGEVEKLKDAEPELSSDFDYNYALDAVLKLLK